MEEAYKYAPSDVSATPYDLLMLASELTAPLEVLTLRILPSTFPATYRSAPSEVSARPAGSLNEALAAAPSALPALPLPASVVTTPVAVMTLRMRWL